MGTRFFAAENTRGFANTWDVLVFGGKPDRDAYVAQRDGYNQWFGNVVDCRAIPKSRVTQFAANYNLSQNRIVKPRPFTGECWLIHNFREVAAIPGYVGDVYVGYPDTDPGERLFK